MVIRLMKDGTPRLLYYNDLQFNTPMDKGSITLLVYLVFWFNMKLISYIYLFRIRWDVS